MVGYETENKPISVMLVILQATGLTPVVSFTRKVAETHEDGDPWDDLACGELHHEEGG